MYSWFDFVPDEIVLRILSYVDKELLFIVRCVCQKWNTLGNDRALFERKQTISVAMIGAPGVGKTSLIGQLLVQCKNVGEREVAKALASAKELKRESQRLAAIVDTHKEELERGFTIDTRRKRLTGTGFEFDLISMPGNLRYFKNLACGITQADAVVMVVDAREDSFVSQELTLTNLAQMVKVQGIKRVILVVNKMDLVEYRKEAFDRVVGRMESLFAAARLPFIDSIAIPCATMDNVNVHGSNGREMRWYSGPTVFGALDAMKSPSRALHKPLRIAIDKTYSINGIGTVVTGTVVQGIVRTEQPVKLAPHGLVTEVKSIHLALTHTPTSVAYPGEYIGMALRGIRRNECGGRKIGMITGHVPQLDIQRLDSAGAEAQQAHFVFARGDVRRMLKAIPMYNAEGFIATIAVWNPTGRICAGFEAVIHVHNAQIPAKIVEVLEVVQSSPLRSEARARDLVYRGEVVVAKFTVHRAALEPEEACSKLGRFIMRNKHQVIGGGIIREVLFESHGRVIDKR